MAGAEIVPDGGFESVAERRGEGVACGWHDEEENAFVRVLRAAAADAEGVCDVGVEGRGFDYGVDFAAAEADS